jgi:glycosyltransferase involved in cell wall biosynthesis
MKKAPFVSIVIPTLNEEKFLPLLLDDLAKQIFRDFEVIVVDGNSEDQTVKKAQKFIAKLPEMRILSSKRHNVSHQRNLGGRAAKAPVIVFIDADCRIEPGFLLGLSYRWFTNKTDILSFYLRPDVPGKRNETIATALNLFYDLQSNFKTNYLLEALFAINKRCFLAVGGFDENRSFDEGHKLLESANFRGFKAKIVKDPTYTFSFRRLRRYGLVQTAGSIAKIELARLIGKKYLNVAHKCYPMNGGAQFDYDPGDTSRFMVNIKKLIKYISEAI